MRQGFRFIELMLIPSVRSCLFCFWCFFVGLSLYGGEDWRTEADWRIEEIRMGSLTLAGTGALPEGSVLKIALDRHHFAFGTALAAGPMREGNPYREQYLDFVRRNFNTLVSENEMKWYTIEKERHLRDYRTAEQFMDFAAAEGMRVRGHTLFWAKENWVQEWVRNLSLPQLEWHVYWHLDRTVERFKGRIWAWDVNNEMIAGSFFQDRLGKGIREHFFRRAHELDPEAVYFVNDYAVLADGSFDNRRFEAYVEQIEAFLEAGVPVGGIGIQEHQAGRFTAVDGDFPKLDPWVIWARLDRLAEFGLPIHLTEVSFPTACPERRAEELEIFYRVIFSHPAVEALLLWGFWQRAHFLGEQAPLIDADFRMLPAGKRLEWLLHEEWTTRETLAVNGEEVRFRGFFGEYAVEWENPETGETKRGRVHFTPQERVQRIDWKE